MAGSFWTPTSFQGVTGGRWLVEPGDANAAIRGVSIDTRTLKLGQAYIAIKGDRFDGHSFVTQAMHAGAAVALVEQDVPVVGRGAVLRVDDTVRSLQNLARAYRDELRCSGCKVIAITGSNGKTTTRNIVHHILTTGPKPCRGQQSPKSFNNHIGVPYTVLMAQREDDFIVVEIGSNHPGEVASLAAIVRPDAAVVTSVGHEHMEFFGTLEAVAEEEFSVLRYVEPGGLGVVPIPDRLPCEPSALGHLPGDVRLVRFENDAAVPLDFPLLGEHNRRNAAAAAAVARWMGLTKDQITDALRTAAPVEGRLQAIRAGQVLILNDAYNANPSSMREALITLGTVASATRRVAVVADMLELGEDGPHLHRATAGALFELEREGRPVERVFTIGPLSMHTAEALRQRWDAGRVTAYGKWSDDVPGAVAAELRGGDAVLLKGSRGMRLERLLPAIQERFGVQM